MKFTLKYPVKPFKLNQGWGTGEAYYSKIGLKGHNGYDFYTVDGQEVYATHDGVITYAGEDGSGGLTIVIRTKDKYEYGAGEVYFKTIYCHLQKGSFKVVANQEVKCGDLIACADNTGWSTGTHLHFGLKPVYQGEQDWQWMNLEQTNGYAGAIDPTPYFDGTFAKKEAPFLSTVKYGQSGEDVKNLQKFLIEKGVNIPAGPTGYFGPQTLKALLEALLKCST